MTPSKYAFQAGLFILLSIAAAIFLITRVAESRSTPKDAKTYTAVFAAGEDIAGLSPGNEVRLMGVKIGRVQKVQVVAPTDADSDASIHVRFVVGNGVELRQTDPRVELQTALTGGAWLNILSVGTGAPLAENAEVPAKATNLIGIMADVRDEMNITLAAMRGDMDEVSTELVQTADGIESFANNADGVIQKIDKEIEELLAQTTGVMTDIRAVFGDSGEDIRTTLAKLSSLSQTLDTELPETLKEVNAFLNKAEASIEGVDEMVAELTGTATDARKIFADNRANINRTIQSARRSVDELEGLVDDLRANPSRLIWPPDEKDLRNSDLYAAARTYAKAAEDLESAAAALHTATKNDQTDDEELTALRGELMQQFKQFDRLQAEVWERFEK